MSAQIAETLIFDEAALPMCSNPLDSWLAQQQVCLLTDRASPRCLRGYLGTWQVHRARLYLVALRAYGARGVFDRPGQEAGTELSLSGLFPQARGAVCADWYSGRLRCPVGDLLEYRDSGYDSLYEQDMLVDIACGHIERIVFRHNDVEPTRTLMSQWQGAVLEVIRGPQAARHAQLVP